MNKLNISEKGSFYICHRCLSFKCNSKNDMKRHYQRTSLCQSSIIINNENEDNIFFYNESFLYFVNFNLFCSTGEPFFAFANSSSTFSGLSTP